MAIATKSGIVITDDQMEALADILERGEWPEGESRVVRGRPRLFGDELQSVTFKVPQRKVSALDRKAAEKGISRSDYLRRLVDRDLARA